MLKIICIIEKDVNLLLIHMSKSPSISVIVVENEIRKKKKRTQKDDGSLIVPKYETTFGW